MKYSNVTRIDSQVKIKKSFGMCNKDFSRDTANDLQLSDFDPSFCTPYSIEMFSINHQNLLKNQQ